MKYLSQQTADTRTLNLQNMKQERTPRCLDVR
jgi:hypothetical protein